MVPVFGTSRSPLAYEIDDRELAEIGAILSEKRCFSLTDYKSACMKRRIAIRMRATHCRDTDEYCRLLQQKEEELELLQKTLTIHVSQFFRNPSLFHKMRLQVFPELFAMAELRADSTLRIWCLGCAGGEEPYSLAILLREHFSRELKQVETVILGTDIDAGTLATAHEGEYAADRLKEVSPLFMKRYFRPQGERFRLIPEIRDMVTFSQDNITSIERYRASDVVLCRNTLIYFARPEQERILNGIADVLPSKGVLVLGKSETLVGKTRKRFTPFCPLERIYRKIA
ncbi:MAG: protein-glutamate O-methyltransferase CheR [Desulfuromonadales bacterium]|nr:protein-glutamate O-methyltransferase CheR [Desulfuromonadales bacterium]